jgi:hypothetical protein
MRSHHRPGRSLFLMFMFSAYIALLGALPVLGGAKLVLAQQQQQQGAKPAQAGASAGQAQAGASAGASQQAARVQQPTFEQLDRNKDGILDKSEAGGVPGLSAIFERADRNKDGKLDRVEFARGLAILDGHK